MNRKSNYLENFSSYGICTGGNHAEASREDRIIVIDDLNEFIKNHYDSYNTSLFGDSIPGKPETILNSKNGDSNTIYKLYAVFDGHCGSVASSFLKYRFPFELCATEEFKTGNYKEALTKALTNIHKELLSCTKYVPELSDCSFCSGSTASIALVTPATTFFAFLGDSPIIVWKYKCSTPEILFKEHSMENTSLHKNLMVSNIFFSVLHEEDEKSYQVMAAGEATRKKILDGLKKDELIFKPIPADSEKYPMDVLIEKEDKRVKGKTYADDIRVGLSKLNVLGSIGDSIYDSRIFNALIDEIEHYRSERNAAYDRLLAQLSKKTGGNLPITEKKKFEFEFDTPRMTLKELKEINPDKFTYENIKSFIVKQERWTKLLKKHIRLPESYDPSSLICTALLNFRTSHKLKCSALKRQPDTCAIPNSELRVFVMASDGVIKFTNLFQNKFTGMVMKHRHSLSDMAHTLLDYLSFLGDDRSVICCSF